MTGKFKAALVVVHPHTMRQETRWSASKQERYSKDERISRMNQIWEVFKTERLRRLVFWDNDHDTSGEWSPAVQPNKRSAYVIATAGGSPRLLNSAETERLKGIIDRLREEGVTDLFFIGGFRMISQV